MSEEAFETNLAAVWPDIYEIAGGVHDDNEGLAEAAHASEYDWFDLSPVLQQIRQWAFSMMVNPWAALGAVLTRLCGDIPPNVVLPPMDGGAVASLNLFTVLVGKSGSGKSEMLGSLDERFMPRPKANDPVVQTELTSGEGIAARFVHATRDSKTGVVTFNRIAWQMFAQTDEVGSLDSLITREGSTLGSTLRTAWSGGRLGASTSDVSRMRSVDSHSYRVAWLIGCQPGKGLSLLNDEAQTTGLTQRMLFVPMRDPHLALDGPDPELPKHALQWARPELPFPRALGGRLDGDMSLAIRHVITVDPMIHDDIRTERRKLKVTGEGISGHWQLTKLKVAALLAFLHGEDNVGYDWWVAADSLMSVSDNTRKYLQAELAASTRRKDLARARSESNVEEFKEDIAMRKAVADLLRVTKAHQSFGGKHPNSPCTAACKDNISKTYRPLWKEAVAKAEASDLLMVERTKAANGRESTKWTIVG